VNLSSLHALCSCVLVVVPLVFCLSVRLLVFWGADIIVYAQANSRLEIFRCSFCFPLSVIFFCFQSLSFLCASFVFSCNWGGVMSLCVCILKSVEVFFGCLL
jgi:hypothetical protein